MDTGLDYGISTEEDERGLKKKKRERERAPTGS